MENYLPFARQLALEAGKVLQQFWGKITVIHQKEFAWDLVTEADRASEALIIKSIQTHFPSHAILSEEAGLAGTKEAEFLWVVDPLDGTTNYTHQYPMVAVSIGLLKDGKPLAGVIYNPIYQELFCAEKGKGATLNDQPMHVSRVTETGKSLLATGFAYNRATTSQNNYREFCRLTNLSQGVRRGGAAALDLASVAAGRLDGYWEGGIQPWDVAAGALLVAEAGGKVTAYNGGPLDIYSGHVLATNSLIHAELSQELCRTTIQFPFVP